MSSTIVVPVSDVLGTGPEVVVVSKDERTRLVPHVPIGGGKFLPCLWKSHKITLSLDNNGLQNKVIECLLLVSRDPLLTLRAEVEVEAWQTFGNAPVEW